MVWLCVMTCVVLRGEFDMRPVAVKRILPECFQLAEREVCICTHILYIYMCVIVTSFFRSISYVSLISTLMLSVIFAWYELLFCYTSIIIIILVLGARCVVLLHSS